MVAYAKQKEARLAENMGYNPYQARLMGNTVSSTFRRGDGVQAAKEPTGWTTSNEPSRNRHYCIVNDLLGPVPLPPSTAANTFRLREQLLLEGLGAAECPSPLRLQLVILGLLPRHNEEALDRIGGMGTF